MSRGQGTSKQREQKAVKKDKSTIILILLTLILFVLVLIFFSKNLVPSIVQSGRAGIPQTELPEITRVGLNAEDEIQRNLDVIPEEDTIPVEKPQEKIDDDPSEEISLQTAFYFITVNDDGVISLKSVQKQVFYSDDSLKKVIELLLQGPNANEINKGFFSLIPENSQLLSAKTENGIAYLNFNESFRFNSLGREGYVAQLQQIVYTATELDGINSVQFIIEGRRLDFIGADGIYIKDPISRSDFQ